MIDRNHALPVTRQAIALNISRSGIYYQPRPHKPFNLALMRRMDQLHLDYPYAGSRLLTALLNREGYRIGRKRIVRLMRKMGIEALYRKPNTSRKHPAHAIYPYLLRGLNIHRPNQVWAMDITYIPMARGFVYLAAVVDWYSRRILSWRLSITFTINRVWLSKYWGPALTPVHSASSCASTTVGIYKKNCKIRFILKWFTCCF